MDRDHPRPVIAVVGAGAMGCYFAARLAASGQSVTLIDVDDDRLAALARDGVTVHDDSGSQTVAVNACRASAMAGPVDVLILFTKGMHTRAAAASVAHLVGPETHAVTLQNGLGNAEMIAEVVSADRILVGVTDIPCDLQGPTTVSSHGSGRVWLGAFRGASQEAIVRVVELLRAGGMDALSDPNVKVAIWEKVAFNASMNALCAITSLPVGGIASPTGRRLIDAICDEVVAVATAHGIAVDRSSIREKVEHALANHVQHKPSMLQDLLAGRATEIETINGAIVAAGETVGVATPVNRTLSDLVRTIEAAASRGTPG